MKLTPPSIVYRDVKKGLTYHNHNSNKKFEFVSKRNNWEQNLLFYKPMTNCRQVSHSLYSSIHLEIPAKQNEIDYRDKIKFNAVV